MIAHATNERYGPADYGAAADEAALIARDEGYDTTTREAWEEMCYQVAQAQGAARRAGASHATITRLRDLYAECYAASRTCPTADTLDAEARTDAR